MRDRETTTSTTTTTTTVSSTTLTEIPWIAAKKLAQMEKDRTDAIYIEAALAVTDIETNITKITDRIKANCLRRHAR
jgi:hypothetical protein